MEDISLILLKVVRGDALSKVESAQFDAWMQLETHRKQYQSLERLYRLVYATQPHTFSNRELLKRIKGTARRRIVYKWSLSAVAVCLLFIGSLFFFRHQESSTNVMTDGVHQGVTLTLSDGTVLTLEGQSGVVDSVLATEAINAKNEEHTLIYENKQKKDAVGSIYHTLTIPPCCDYQISLSDGTKVWLNASTEFRYPVAFTGSTREVYVKGEAFFEVAPDSLHPFFVHAGETTTRVLGTSFNVRNYRTTSPFTTLISGRVEMNYRNTTFYLKPGEQFSCVAGEGRICKVDTAPIIAWKSGYFMFKACRLADLLEEVARWYDVEIFYQNTALQEQIYTATFKRSLKFDELLKVLGKTNKVHFALNGKTLVVTNY